MTILLRVALPTYPSDRLRAARRALDAWKAAVGGSPEVIGEEDPRASEAAWELILREPEAMVPPAPLAPVAPRLGRARALAPGGFFRGGSV